MKLMSAKESLDNLEDLVIPLLTVEDLLGDAEDAREQKRVFDAVHDELEVGSSFSTVILDAAEAGRPAIEKLSAIDAEDLAASLGCSVEELKAMPLDEFITKCDDCAEPSVEVIAEMATTYALSFAFGYLLGTAAVKLYEFFESQGLKRLARKLRKSMPGSKLNDAVKNITYVTWQKKEYDKQIATLKAALPVLKTDVSKIFKEDYPLANLEKVASSLWSFPHGIQFDKVDPNRYDGYVGNWASWANNIPAREKGKTLGALGFDADSLLKTAEDLGELVSSLVDIAGIRKDIRAEQKKALNKGSILQHLKAWWNDDKATKEEKARKRRMIGVKFDSCHWLLQGIKDSLNLMCADILGLSTKINSIAKDDSAPDVPEEKE